MNLSRRSFLALASGLLLPEPERVRAYSFLPGEPRLWEAQLGGPVADLLKAARREHEELFVPSTASDGLGWFTKSGSPGVYYADVFLTRMDAELGREERLSPDAFAAIARPEDLVFYAPPFVQFDEVVEDAQREIRKLIIGREET